MGENKKTVEIYTDGACSGNPGPGGWAAILMYRGKERIVSGGEAATTNNRMELTAALRGLMMLNQPCDVSLYSDSAYLVDAMTKGWLYGWRRNNWKTSGKDDVKNRDLWESLLLQIATHNVTWVKVKGHSTNEHNNRCDELARAEIKKLALKTTEGEH